MYWRIDGVSFWRTIWIYADFMYLCTDCRVRHLPRTAISSRLRRRDRRSSLAPPCLNWYCTVLLGSPRTAQAWLNFFTMSLADSAKIRSLGARPAD